MYPTAHSVIAVVIIPLDVMFTCPFVGGVSETHVSIKMLNNHLENSESILQKFSKDNTILYSCPLA